ncbi:unnamed protein product [Trifolium pratense]|uniref:Uncharacterized protein n=1 Tax=Trifolium pratense TaxID=57577 RepID=A0ACB0KB44_TRIPR|nr:unnamed protein product [Trifolium pratense]
MCANEGYQPSYAWRSILSARTLVEKGGLWRIGDGRKVRIWKDIWMPDMKIISSRNNNCPLSDDALVMDLIDVDTKQWMRDMIYSWFDSGTAKQIISIPLSLRLPSDTLVWNWEKDGAYSVRSAYHVICDEKERSLPGPSVTRKNKVWKEIWKAPVPNKVKNFMWRLTKNILPTRANLHKKGTQLFCTILWKFWAARNNVVFRGDKLEPVCLVDEAMSFVQEFNDANPPRRGRVSLPLIVVTPPVSRPSFSVFVDAGCKLNGPTVWGLVLKNHDRITTFSACKCDDIAVDPIMAEALGVRWAIQFVREQGLHSVCIFSDAENVVNCIAKKVKIDAIEMVAQDCRELLSSLPNVSVLFVRRDQNIDAHNLASLARLVGNRTWVGAAPKASVMSNYAENSAANCIVFGCFPAFF